MIRDVNIPKFDKFLPRNYRIQEGSDFLKADKIWWLTGDDRTWEVQFKSSEAGRKKFEGVAVDGIWFDEEPKDPKAIWAECMTRLIDKDGIWWMTATPIYGSAWLKALSEKDNVFSISGAMWDNPYLPLEAIEAQAEEYDEDERLVRIEGKYLTFGGNPVFNIRILSQMIEDLKNDTSTYEVVFDAEAETAA